MNVNELVEKGKNNLDKLSKEFKKFNLEGKDN